MLSRLEMMVLMGAEIPLVAVRRQIASGIDIIIHLSRMRDRTRKVVEVTEVLGVRDGEILLQPLYQYQETGEENGKIEGIWKKINTIKHQGKLLAAGYKKEGTN